VDGFPSTIHPLFGEPTAYRKGVDTLGRTTPRDEHISGAMPHRVELHSGEPIDSVILRLDSVI
jgi:hypothetical protein